jgi:hypothetical protein
MLAMDAAMAVFLLVTVGLPSLFVWSMFRGGRKVIDAERAYLASLRLLRADPTDPNLREKVLALGRRYLEARSRQGIRGGFSELALTNDINAACAHAVTRSGAPSKVEVVNAAALCRDTVAKQVEELNRLRVSRVITDEEFERGKALFLGAVPDKAAAAVSLLRNLDALRTEGVLSPAEFNMKKWEILSERLVPVRFSAAK